MESTIEDTSLGLANTLELLFFFQAEDGIRDIGVTGVQTCALPIFVTVLCSSAHCLGGSDPYHTSLTHLLPDKLYNVFNPCQALLSLLCSALASWET